MVVCILALFTVNYCFNNNVKVSMHYEPIADVIKDMFCMTAYSSVEG